MVDWKIESQRFDGVAGTYDQFRPGYPAELVDHILAVSGIPVGGKILEIGSGTGKATASFAERGYDLTCIEPGANLMAVAKAKLRRYPHIRFINAAFEASEIDNGAYDLVVSAQAFHWIDKAMGYAKAAKALKPGGTLALFWNMYPEPLDAIFAALQQVYKRYAEHFSPVSHTSYQDLILQREKEIADSVYFDDLGIARFPWSERYSTNQYLGLLSTYSDHLRLPDEVRRQFFKEIAQVVDRFGGVVDKPYVGVVYTAKVLPSSQNPCEGI